MPTPQRRRTRIDTLLLDRGLVPSRERARRMVMAGEIWLGDQCITKPGALVTEDAAVEVRGADIPYVSRGGVKLAGALDHWQIEVRDLIAVDIGASTGGFTDCLLQRGARRIAAIDVGYGQFAWKLRTDARVQLFERANIRHFDVRQLAEPADLAVIDVSFISLRLVLPHVLEFLRPDATILALVKPQFEVGKGMVGSGGVVRDLRLQQAAVDTIAQFGQSIGLTCRGSYPSPILGAKGNQEVFLYFIRPPAQPPSSISRSPASP